jgi:hypothetical protein
MNILRIAVDRGRPDRLLQRDASQRLNCKKRYSVRTTFFLHCGLTDNDACPKKNYSEVGKTGRERINPGKRLRTRPCITSVW